MKLHIKNSISTLSAAVLIVASTVTGSCTDDFDNINRDNNVPTSGNFSLQLNAQLRSIAFGQFDFNNGALLAHQIGKTNYNEIAQYSFGTAEYLWNSLYQNLVNIDDMINMAKKQEQPSAEAIGYILKAFCSSQLTDHWGNVPYSEAMQGSKNVYPKYDEQQDIYTGEEGIIRLLQRADDLLATSKDQLPSDIIYEGNRMKWRKLANSLRLRYLIRISN
uniref:SusD/RagB family nutrient-binding outer membrane lipoprotein n=1 Tax=Hallella bergensis TaxID=242750 RepID=UPI0023F48C61